MRRAPETSAQPIGEDRFPSMSFSGGRSLAPEWMPEPNSKLTFVLSLLTRHCDCLGKVRGRVLPFENRLPGDSRHCRRLFQSASLSKFREDDSTAPIEVHGVIIPRIMHFVHPARGRARGRRQPRSKIHFPITFRFPVRFHALFRISAAFPNFPISF